MAEEKPATVPVDECKPERKTEHVHPCICDLKRNRKRRPLTKDELKRKTQNYLRKEISAEPSLVVENGEKRMELELKMDRQRELLQGLREKCRKRLESAYVARPINGTDYDMVYVKRTDDITCGRIDWKKQPVIEVKYNRVYDYRKANKRYCGRNLRHLTVPHYYMQQPTETRTLPPPPPP